MNHAGVYLHGLQVSDAEEQTRGFALRVTRNLFLISLSIGSSGNVGWNFETAVREGINMASKATMMVEPKDRTRGPRRHVVFDGEITLIPPDGSGAVVRPSGFTVVAARFH